MVFRQMRPLVLILLAGLVFSCTPNPPPPPGLPVFPGAEGFGTRTPAGRGGRIIKVTNLENTGPGSLRAALEAAEPRIIVFEVSGTISLTRKLSIKHPFVTVAGQTAPSPGITLRGAGITVSTHDVLLQHLRIRVGDNPEGPDQGDRDCIQLKESDAIYNVVIDHISASWGVDENISTWGALHDVTVSNSIISEALKDSLAGHPRGYGLLIGDHARNVTVARNLFAHNRDRNPLLKGGTTSVVVNNLIYNAGPYYFGYMADDYNSGPSKTTIVGNIFIEGKDSSQTPAFVARESLKAGCEIFFESNRYVGKGIPFRNKAEFDPRVGSPPVRDPTLVLVGVKDVPVLVISHAGARPADRDSVDHRIVSDVSRRTGGQIDSQTEVGGWPELQRNRRPFVIPPDQNNDDDGDGYTNIEEMLHQMAAVVEGKVLARTDRRPRTASDGRAEE